MKGDQLQIDMEEITDMFRAMLHASAVCESMINNLVKVANEVEEDADIGLIDTLHESGINASRVIMNLSQVMPEKLGLDITGQSKEVYKRARTDINWKA